MEFWVWVLLFVLLAVIFVLAAKIILLRRAARELAADLREHLATDTNTLLDVNSRDSAMRALAAELNTQLRVLRAQRHRYEQGDRELKEAVTNISHDLRTPLTAICGYLDLLQREEKSDAVRRYLTQIENRTDALRDLTEELFRYSVVASPQELHPERLDIVRSLEENLLSFYGAMQEAGIRPQISLPEAPIYRELDAGALNRVFSNILSNALKYSDGDLSVTMQTEGCIVFSNTAKGLDAVAVGRLFDRFYTVEAGRNATGLGLSIAKLLIERMGGQISAEYRAQKLYITVTL